MKGTVRLNVVKIGNSRGVRLPRPLLAAAKLGAAVEAEVVEGGLLLRPADAAARAGWAEAFAAGSPDDDPERDAWLAFGDAEWVP